MAKFIKENSETKIELKSPFFDRKEKKGGFDMSAGGIQ